MEGYQTNLFNKFRDRNREEFALIQQRLLMSTATEVNDDNNYENDAIAQDQYQYYQQTQQTVEEEFDEEGEDEEIINNIERLDYLKRTANTLNVPNSPTICTINTSAIADVASTKETETYEFNHEIFIEEVKKYPCLWNTRLNSYKEQPKKKLAWQNILVSMQNPTISVEYLKSQWKSLRDNFKRCLTNRKNQTRSGAKGRKLSTCKFMEQLMFLSDIISHANTESNLSLPNNVDIPSPVSPDSLASSTSRTSPVSLASPTSLASSASFSSPQELNTDTDSSKYVAKLPYRKRKKDIAANVDLMLVNTLKEMNAAPKSTPISSPDVGKTMDNKDSEHMFCQSLVQQLKSLPAQKNKLARIKIQQVLYDIEFSD